MARRSRYSHRILRVFCPRFDAMVCILQRMSLKKRNHFLSCCPDRRLKLVEAITCLEISFVLSCESHLCMLALFTVHTTGYSTSITWHVFQIEKTCRCGVLENQGVKLWRGFPRTLWHLAEVAGKLQYPSPTTSLLKILKVGWIWWSFDGQKLQVACALLCGCSFLGETFRGHVLVTWTHIARCDAWFSNRWVWLESVCTSRGIRIVETNI